MQIYLGTDWSHTHHDACWLDEHGPHDCAACLDGLAQWEAGLGQLGASHAACWVGLETAHIPLIDFLWDQGYSKIFVIPPGAIQGARRRYRQTNAHTDQSDAWVIADVLRTDLGHLASLASGWRDCTSTTGKGEPAAFSD